MDNVIPLLVALAAIPLVVFFAQGILVFVMGTLFFSINLVVLSVLWALGVTRKRNY